MNTTLTNTIATNNHTGKSRKARQIVLGLGDSPYAKAAEAHFVRLGFEVSVTKNAKEARKLATRNGANAVALAADLGPETGWLSTVKLTRARPGIRVVLVGNERDATQERFADFAGACGYVAVTEGVTRLVKVLMGSEVACVQ